MEFSVKKFRERAKEMGLKVTPQRIAVYREIVSRKDHPSAEELYETLKGKIEGISLTTVYRTLSSLEKAGFVKRVPTLKDKVRYDARLEPHGHFICKKCGKIVDIEVTLPVSSELLRDVGEIKECSLVCYGICKECRNEKA